MNTCDLLRRLEACLAKNRADVHRSLRAGAPEEALAAFARETGAPSDLVELYRWHDGQADGAPFVFEQDRFLPLEEALRERERNRQRLYSGETYGANGWHESWLPLMSNGAGDCVCVDLDAGRVIRFWHDSPARPLLAADLRGWLAHVVAGIEAGAGGTPPTVQWLSDDWSSPVEICAGALDTAPLVLERGGLAAAGNLLGVAFALLRRHEREIGRPWKPEEHEAFDALAERAREEPWVAFAAALALADFASDVPLERLVTNAEALATSIFDRLRSAPLPSAEVERLLARPLALLPLRAPLYCSNALAEGLVHVVTPDVLGPAAEAAGMQPTGDPRWTR